MKNINKTILFTGCMFSGKSLNLINATLDLKESYQCFKPDIDNRDGDFIVSRDLEIKLPAKRTKNLFEVLNSKSKAIIFDEIQFFDENDFEEIILKLKKMNKTILMSGLDRIATGKFWETYKVAEKLEKRQPIELSSSLQASHRKSLVSILGKKRGNAAHM